MRKADAIEHFGSAANLARALGISTAAVAQWGDLVPRLRAFEIERLTGGVLQAAPDLQPPPADGAAA